MKIDEDERGGKKKIEMAGAKTERSPSPWGLEREGGSVSREKEGVLKNFYIQRN